MEMLLHLVLSALAVLISAYVLPGVSVEGFFSALVVAVVLGILNSVLKPILKLLSLPLTILTFGLFSLVINIVIVLLADQLVSGFSVANWWWALLFSFVVAIVSSFLGKLGK